MISFVKPSARVKFGIAAASTAALLASPLGVLPASASEFDVTNCNASGPNSMLGAITASNDSMGRDQVVVLTTQDCTVSLASTIEITSSVGIYNNSGYDFTLARDGSFTGDIMVVDEPDVFLPIPTEISISGVDFDGEIVDGRASLFEVADSDMYGTVFFYNSDFSNARYSAVLIVNENFSASFYESNFDNNDNVVYAGFGGAIRSFSDIRVFNSTFTDNYASHHGGAIRVDYAELAIYSSTFTNNESKKEGGAIYLATDIEIEYDPDYGYPTNYAMTIISSVFENNTAGEQGGAIYLYGSAADIMSRIGNTTFDSNYAAGVGGAISAQYVDMMIFGFGLYQGGNTMTYPSERSLFVDNSSASDYGAGAINAYYSDVNLYGTTFEGNTASRGGALVQFYGDLSVTSSRFEANEATGENVLYGNGGAIQAFRLDSANIRASSFTENVASYAHGAVYLQGLDDFEIYANTFYNNQADYASQLFVSSQSTNSLMTNNTFVDTLPNNSSDLVYLYLGENSDYIGANIFASTYDRGVYVRGGINAGANLYTYEGSIFAPTSRDTRAGLQHVYSANVSWADLDLQELTEYRTFYGPDVFTAVIPLGPDSVAIDTFSIEFGDMAGADNHMNVPEEFLPWAFYNDGRGGQRLSEDGEPLAGDALDSGAFEAGARAWYDMEEEPNPTTPNVSITRVSKPSISAGGDSFSVYGTGLNDVTELFVAGVKVSFRVVSSTELAVTTGVLPVGAAEILAIATDGRASFQLGVAVTDTPSTLDTPAFWTKNIGNGQIKLYAKNVVGAGKVRFMHNGTEIAWINAVDETDPKLRKAAGAAYLVRTVNLVPGKNRMEITLDGVRVRFTTYSR